MYIYHTPYVLYYVVKKIEMVSHRTWIEIWSPVSLKSGKIHNSYYYIE